MTPLERALEHHLNACLDNHAEADCAAVQLARELSRLQDAYDEVVVTLQDAYDTADRVGAEL